MRAPASFSTTRAPRLAGSAVSRRLMHSPRSYFDASTPRPRLRLAQQDRPGARSLRQRACALMAAEPAAGHAPSCGGMPHHTARTPDQPFGTVENFVLARLPLCQEKVPAEVPTVDSRSGGPGRCRSSGTSAARGPRASRACSTTLSRAPRRATASLRRSRRPPTLHVPLLLLALGASELPARLRRATLPPLC